MADVLAGYICLRVLHLAKAITGTFYPEIFLAGWQWIYVDCRNDFGLPPVFLYRRIIRCVGPPMTGLAG